MRRGWERAGRENGNKWGEASLELAEDLGMGVDSWESMEVTLAETLSRN